MNTYFMFGKYSAESIKGISAERTKKAKDLVFIMNLLGVEEVFKASAGLHKLTGISFSSVPAITIEKFDKILA